MVKLPTHSVENKLRQFTAMMSQGANLELHGITHVHQKESIEGCVDKAL